MKTPWIVGHRGASGHAPENTLASFERAVQLGARFIETDLHLTRDGRFVAIHDSSLHRTTNGRGEVFEHTLAELRKLDAGLWYDRAYGGQHIPTLEEVLEFARQHDVVFYLEVKYDVSWGMHHALVSALRDAGSAARTVVISFDRGTIANIQRLDPSILLGLLTEDASLDPVQAAQDVGSRQLCPRSTILTADLVKRAHRAELQVVTWTVNDPDKMRSAITTGVDGIMTDFPDRLRALLEDEEGQTLSSRQSSH